MSLAIKPTRENIAILAVCCLIGLSLGTIVEHNKHHHTWSLWGEIKVAGGFYRWRRCHACGKAEIEWEREDGQPVKPDTIPYGTNFYIFHD